MNTRFLFFLSIIAQSIYLYATNARFVMHLLVVPSQYKDALTKCGKIVVNTWFSKAQTRIEVKFRKDLPKLNLTQAYPTNYYNFDGAKYLIAIAKLLSGKDINANFTGLNRYDMVISFNLNAKYYLGVDAKPDRNEAHFVSVCIHEVVHGLFMTTNNIRVEHQPDGHITGGFNNLIIPRFDHFLSCETPEGDCSLASCKKIAETMVGHEILVAV